MGTGAIKLQHALAEEDLHAYVDGLLPPERRAAIEAYLAAHPAEARRVDEYRAQNLRLHALLDGYEQAPIPPALQYLQLKLESALRRQRRFRRGLKAAWSLLVMATVGVGGYWGYERYQARLDPLVAFTKQATEAHLLYADEHRADAPQEDRGMNVVAWLSQRHTGAPFHEPNLEQLGFTLVHSRILPTADGPAAQLLYRDKDGLPVTLYIATSKKGRHTQFTFMQEGRNSLFYWRNADFSYSLVGEIEKDELLRIARLISEELGTSQPLVAPAERRAPEQRDAQSEPRDGTAAAPADRPVKAAAPAAAPPPTQEPGTPSVGQITPVAGGSPPSPAEPPHASAGGQPAADPGQPAAQPKAPGADPAPDQAAPQEHKQKEL